MNLEFDCNAAMMAGEGGQPEWVMARLGIRFEFCEVKGVNDRVVFLKCSNVPDNLPGYLRRVGEVDDERIIDEAFDKFFGGMGGTFGMNVRFLDVATDEDVRNAFETDGSKTDLMRVNAARVNHVRYEDVTDKQWKEMWNRFYGKSRSHFDPYGPGDPYYKYRGWP